MCNWVTDFMESGYGGFGEEFWRFSRVEVKALSFEWKTSVSF